MKVGVVGLGLIGGSAAKAYKAAGHTVYGYDINSTVLGYARLDGTMDKELAKDTLQQCDLLLLTATPSAVIEYLTAHARYIHAKTLVVDFCGTKLLHLQRSMVLLL